MPRAIGLRLIHFRPSYDGEVGMTTPRGGALDQMDSRNLMPSSSWATSSPTSRTGMTSNPNHVLSRLPSHNVFGRDDLLL